jgi:hypothetical protein
MSFVNAPRSSRVRQWLFWVHLCAGLGVGVLALVIGLSGAALVYSPELEVAPRWASAPVSNPMPLSARSLGGDFFESFEVNSRSSRGGRRTGSPSFGASSVGASNRYRRGMRQRLVRPSVSCSGLWSASTRAATTSFSSPTREAPGWSASIGRRYSRPWFNVLSATAQQMSTRAESLACSSATAATRVKGCSSWRGRSRRRRDDRP